PSFAFMDKWLKGREGPISEPDRAVPIEDLKVLKPGEVPPGNRNDTIHETFLPVAEVPPIPGSAAEWEALRAKGLQALRAEVFAGWPREGEAVPLDQALTVDLSRGGIRLRAFDFTSQVGVRPRLWLLSESGAGDPKRISVRVVAEASWRADWAGLISAL